MLRRSWTVIAMTLVWVSGSLTGGLVWGEAVTLRGSPPTQAPHASFPQTVEGKATDTSLVDSLSQAKQQLVGEFDNLIVELQHTLGGDPKVAQLVSSVADGTVHPSSTGPEEHVAENSPVVDQSKEVADPQIVQQQSRPLISEDATTVTNMSPVEDANANPPPLASDSLGASEGADDSDSEPGQGEEVPLMPEETPPKTILGQEVTVTSSSAQPPNGEPYTSIKRTAVSGRRSDFGTRSAPELSDLHKLRVTVGSTDYVCTPTRIET